MFARFFHVLRCDRTFYIGLVLLTLAVVVLNSAHGGQQGIFRYTHMGIAQSLVAGEGMRDPVRPDSYPIFYPIWGYPAVLAVLLVIGVPPAVGIVTLQAVIAFFTVVVFYRFLRMQPKLWHLIFLMPWFAYASVKWADSIVGALFVLSLLALVKALETQRVLWLIGSMVLLGISLNFRTEYLMAVPFMALAALISRGWRTGVLTGLVLVGGALLFLSPWAVRSYMLDGTVRFSTTNGAHVLYISLGQLASNPWHRVHDDLEGGKYVWARGVSDPYSPAGQALLSQQFKADIRAYPMSFIGKIKGNITTALFGGYYTGEYLTFLTHLGWLKTGIGVPIYYICALILAALTFGGLFFFQVVLAVQLAVLAAVVWYELLGKKMGTYRSRGEIFLAVVACITLFKVLQVGLIQYEPRHMNILALLLLPPFIAWVETAPWRSLGATGRSGVSEA